MSGIRVLLTPIFVFALLDLSARTILHHAKCVVEVVIVEYAIPLFVLTDVKVISCTLTDTARFQVFVYLVALLILLWMRISVLVPCLHAMFSETVCHTGNIEELLHCLCERRVVALHVGVKKITVRLAPKTMTIQFLRVVDERRRVFVMERTTTSHAHGVVVLNMQKLHDVFEIIVAEDTLCFVDFLLINENAITPLSVN